MDIPDFLYKYLIFSVASGASPPPPRKPPHPSHELLARALGGNTRSLGKN